ncbi:MAG: Gldg family protein [Kiritimatiellaeota bacterium]|nr:Gldg family protein [Kiritimatiellota bacterium]
MKKNVLTNWAGLLLLLAVLGLAVALVKGFGLRADLTQQKLYSLSKGSKDLLANLPQDADIALKFYFSRSSEKMPEFYKNYADQVDYLLRSYARLAKRVKVERFDPQPDSEAEEWAQRYGIEGQTVDPYSPPIYFGLAVVCGTREEVIPVLTPRTEQTLEYDISRAISRVAWPRQPVVGVMDCGLGVLGEEPNPMMMMQRRQPQNPGWIAFQQLRKDNTVRRVEPDEETIPPDLSLLIVVHPKNLSEATLYALDQFVLRGGRLMVCVDPFSVTEAMEAQARGIPLQAAPSSHLGHLLDAWGVGFDPSRVVADMAAITRVGNNSGGSEDSPLFLSLKKDNINAKSPLTSQLSTLLMPYSGALENRKAEGLLFTPLVESSADQSCLVDLMAVQYGLPKIEPTGRSYVLAARVSGSFKTAFPGGKPASEIPADAENAITPHLASGNDGMVVIFADCDFLYNQFSVQQLQFFNLIQPFNDNIALFLNAAEQLTGRNELVAIRTRANSQRPFTVVDGLENEARRKFQQKEEELQQKLGEANRKIQELQAARTDSHSIMLSKEQQEQIMKFREEQRDTNRQLKNVRRDLRQDIERLGVRLKAANILLIPALVILAGIVRTTLRKRK